MEMLYLESMSDRDDKARFRERVSDRVVFVPFMMIGNHTFDYVMNEEERQILICEGDCLQDILYINFLRKLLASDRCCIILVGANPEADSYPDVLKLYDSVVHIDYATEIQTFESIVLLMKRVKSMIRQSDQAPSGLYEVYNEKLVNIIDALPDLVWLKDIDGYYLTCNRKFESFFNASREEIIGKSDYDFVDKETADMFRLNDRMAVNNGQARSNEETLIYGDDGHVEIVETIKMPLYTNQGQAYAVLGIARDITHRKEVEMNLQEDYDLLEKMVEERTRVLKITSERLRLATRAANIGTWDWDLRNNQLWWDPVLYDFFGYENTYSIRDEKFASEWMKSVHPEDYDYVAKEMDFALKYKTEDEVRFRIIREDGELRYLSVLFNIIRDDMGIANRLVGMCLDVTKDMVQKEQLREATLAANQANEAKTRFLANMSHEIRTPINAIIGMNYLLDQSDLDEVQKDYVHKIQLSSNQLLRIVTDILDFSKIEAGKLQLEYIRFDLKKIISNIYDMHKHEAKAKNLEFNLVWSFDEEYCLVGDPLRLEQVLNNLINNAIKFTNKGAISLNIKELIHDGNKTNIRFMVEDSGIGISNQQLKHLFEAFEQGDSSTTREYGGTGLGLIISQEILDLMDSSLRVTSRLGQGSRFIFDLSFPVCKVPSKSKLEEKEEVVSLSGISILVVEDNALNQELIQEILMNHEAQVFVSNHGQDAIDQLRAGLKIDAILMDIQMPVLDGKEATQLIRQMEAYKDIPIIALTADVMKGVKEELIQDGMTDYIPKPVHVQEMIKVIKKWV